jgi:hypothetical protein
VVLGGLFLSTVFTLILVPALFSLTMEWRTWFMERLFGKRAVPAKAPAAKEAHPTPRPQLVPR